ncbi:MAG: hypothetical protein IMY67_06480, partial [Bacteroidetes bacterium]|nr:hypothetical protein [Bacteroidota bacterium]
MKKKIMKLKENLIVWLDSLVIKRFEKIALKYKVSRDLVVTTTAVIAENPEYNKAIKMMYKYIAQKELVLSTELKPIKKGTRKYYIIVCKDKNLTTIFNLNRHDHDG